MKTDLPEPTIPTRYARLGAEHPRRKQWSYIKKRKNPTGKMGRPKSLIPVADRRRLARQHYQTNLTQRGQRLIRLLVSAAAADSLASLAKTRGISPGQIVEELLMSGGTGPAPSLPSVVKPVQASPVAKPVQNKPPAPNSWFAPD
jgi:hypothetical protein